jgi:DNA-directed RNA polymerase subunit RPC12/RpoP
MGFVLLKSFNNYIEAHIALSMLEEEGINCHIEDEHTVTILNFSSGMRLMVYDSQLERSREILKLSELEYLKTIVCPNCKQKALEIKYVMQDDNIALKKMPFGRFISMMSRLISKDDNQTEVKHYVCTNCHKEYEDLPTDVQ